MILKDKVALITGASRGIGRAIAEEYITQGAHVIAVARTVADLERLDDYAQTKNSSITIVPLDITDFSKIDALGYNIYERFGKLDVFVGNAAIFGGCYPINHCKPEMWQKIIDTNLTANWRFIRSFDLLFRKAEAARIIFITDIVAKTNDAYYGPYAISKSGLETLAKIYANETLKTNIKINLVVPCHIKTRIYKEAYNDFIVENLKNPEDITEIFVKLASRACNVSGKLFTLDQETVY